MVKRTAIDTAFDFSTLTVAAQALLLLGPGCSPGLRNRHLSATFLGRAQMRRFANWFKNINIRRAKRSIGR